MKAAKAADAKVEAEVKIANVVTEAPAVVADEVKVVAAPIVSGIFKSVV